MEGLSESPPPAYDSLDPEPSAPPSSALAPGVPYQLAPGDFGYQRNSLESPPESGAQRLTFQETSLPQRAVESYVRYSMARHLRQYMTPEGERLDPELDVEAQFSRRAVRDARASINKKERLKCLSGWLYCCGVVFVILYIIYPLAMIAIGSAGFSHCTPNSRVIPLYLTLNGILVTCLMFFRSLASIMTCCKNRNFFKSEDSLKFTSLICSFEVLFYVIAIGTLVFTILGSIWIFASDMHICSDTVVENCCSSYVYVSSAFFNSFQYFLFVVSLVYTCNVMFCSIKCFPLRSKAVATQK